MSNARLWVLGLLAGEGHMHGHQIRRRAELSDTADWAELSPGGLYATLHRMEAEGLVSPTGREQTGKFPARTVYAITFEGQLELSVLRHQAPGTPQLSSDPVDVALFTAAGMPETELRGFLNERRQALEVRLAGYRLERARLEEHGYLRPASLAVLLHLEQRIEAELGWHIEVADLLPAIAASQANPGNAAPSAAAGPPARRRRKEVNGPTR